MDSKKGETDLCTTCEQLDFRFLFGASSRETVAEERTSRSTMFETGICLGSTAELRKRSYCRFCHLVFEMLRTLRPDGTTPFEKDHQYIMCYLKNLVRDCTGLQLDASKAMAADRPFAFQLLIKTQPSIVEEYEGGFHQDLPHPLLIQKISKEVTLENSYYGRELPASLIDFNLLSRWTETCRTNISEQSQAYDDISKSKQPRIRLRLIDIITQSLVGPMEAPEYIALSYMWGRVTPFILVKSNISDLQKNGALSIDNPKFLKLSEMP